MLRLQRAVVPYLVEVDVHALELEIRGAIVAANASICNFAVNMRKDFHIHTRAVEAMLAGDGLPEGSTNLVTL